MSACFIQAKREKNMTPRVIYWFHIYLVSYKMCLGTGTVVSGSIFRPHLQVIRELLPPLHVVHSKKKGYKKFLKA